MVQHIVLWMAIVASTPVIAWAVATVVSEIASMVGGLVGVGDRARRS
jgi:hypothetical protein